MLLIIVSIEFYFHLTNVGLLIYLQTNELLILKQNAFSRVDGMVFLERSTFGHVRIHLSALASVLAPHKRQKSTNSGIDLHSATALRRVL